MLRRRRTSRALMRRFKTPSSTKYFRYKVDILASLAKIAGDIIYGWTGSATNIYDINTQLSNDANFNQFCKQFSYVRIKGISFLANPDIRNQSLSASGFVGVSCWPRGFTNSFGTWDKNIDNPFFKILNPTSNTYKYCNLLGGDNDWKSTGSGQYTTAQLFAITNFLGSVAQTDAPQWLVKVSVHVVFKTPVQ